MKKLSFFLVALLTTFALGLSGCSEDNTEPTVVPVISAEDLSVPAEAGERSLSYEITDPIDGQMISASSNQTWVHDFDYSTPNVIKFQVDENTGEARTAELTLSYPQAESVKVTLSQEAIAKIENVASEEVMPDEVFRNYVLTNFDTDGDGVLTVEEAAAVKAMEYKNIDVSIYDLKGIEYFTGLETLDFSSQMYETADFTYNTNLKRVTVGYGSALESVNVSTCANLEYLSVLGSSALETLDVSNNPKLTQLIAANTGLSTIDLSKNTNLTSLSVSGPNLTSVDLSSLTALETLTVGGDAMTSVDVSKNVNLISLTVSGEQITEIDVTKNTKLQELFVNYTALTELDVTNCRDLRTLELNYTFVTELDLSHCLKLTDCSAYQVLTLQKIILAEGQHVNFSLSVDSSDLIEYVTPEAPADITANAVDPDFRAYLLENFDTNGDGELSEEEAANVTEIDITGMGITSIEGVEYFYMPNVQILKVADNDLTSLDLVNFQNIEEIYCSNNQIAGEWNFSNCPNIRIIEADHNQLTSLSLLSANSKLEKVIANDNQLTSAKASFIPALVEVNLANNQMTAFDCRNNDVIKTVNISNNPGITTWQIWSMTTLENIDISNTGMTEFLTYGDSGYGPALKTLNCSGTQLATLDVSGNTSLEVLKATNCPNLKSVNIGALNLTTMEVDEGVEIIKSEAPAGEGLAINETNFPDETFRTYVADNFDTDGNGELSDAEIAAATVISLTGTDKTNTITVTSLEGIKNFTALKELTVKWVSGLTTIDMSNCTTLETCNYIESEGLTTYSVQGCTNLIWFQYDPNNYPALVTEIDLSTCPNINFDYDKFYISMYLTGTVWVSESQLSAATKWFNDHEFFDYAQFQFKVKENTPVVEGLAVDATNFPDETLRNYVSTNFDTDGNGALSDAEIAAANVISFVGTEQAPVSVTTLSGIEKLTALKELTIKCVVDLATINVDNFTTLETMRVDGCRDLTTYTVNNCTNLKLFRYNPYPYDTLVKELDISTCPNLVIDPMDSQGFMVDKSIEVLWISAEQEYDISIWNYWKYGESETQLNYKVKE